MKKNGSLADMYPELALEWHPAKNGSLTPDSVAPSSRNKVWWLLPYDDPKTGRHFDFEWEARVVDRAKAGRRCPYLTGNAIWPGFNDLASVNPEIAAQWHPTKNGGLTPQMVTAGSNTVVWWLLPYDDPKTGRHFDFEWQAKVTERAKGGTGCPYLSGRSVWPGFNDLASTDPELAKQWHPSKNGDLTPQTVTAGSNTVVWWLLPYDDPKTGRHFDFEWQAKVTERAKGGTGCPYLSGRSVWPGFNDLASTNPELAAQWHPDKNGDLTPQMVTAGSKKQVWWLLPYDDPATGKHHDFVWQAQVCNRTGRKSGCPYLSNMAIWPGYNDLSSTHPELSKQWNHSKNGCLTPETVTAASTKRVWWICRYDDPNTGESRVRSWQESVVSRVSKEETGPSPSQKAVWSGFNDLASANPELARQWDYTKNGNLTPQTVSAGSKEKVWWILPYDDPKTGRHFDFSWQAAIHNRVSKDLGCPYLSNAAAWPGYNDLETTHPQVAAQWHPKKNGSFTPQQVTAGSLYEAWWSYPYDDPRTGRHFDFEWQQTVSLRASEKASVCPFLSGAKVWPGFNDLATVRPDVAKQWHPTKNGDLLPTDVTAGSTYEAWWIYPYDDPQTGRHFDFEWQQIVYSRTGEDATECPFLSGAKIWPGYNDLAATNPDIAAQWHPTKNGGLTPQQVTAGSHFPAWWLYPYNDPRTGRHFDFEWQQAVNCRTAETATECPFLSSQKIWPGFNDLATVRPDVAAQWHPGKNGEVTPQQVTANSRFSAWWIYPYDDPNTGKHFDFEWQQPVMYRTADDSTECPFLSGQKIWRGYNDLATTHPQIAAQWHPFKNGSLRPTDVSAGSTSYATWLYPYDDPETGKHHDFEWDSTIVARTGGTAADCPYLSDTRVWTGYNDLATLEPEIAEQFLTKRNLGMTADRVYVRSSYKYWWKCPRCGYEWRASVVSRTKMGTGCPKCARDRKRFWK